MPAQHTTFQQADFDRQRSALDLEQIHQSNLIYCSEDSNQNIRLMSQVNCWPRRAALLSHATTHSQENIRSLPWLHYSQSMLLPFLELWGRRNTPGRQ